MKDILFFLFVILSLGATAITSDQEGFYPAQSGTTLKYSHYSEANQTKGYIRQTVDQITNTDSTSSLSYTIGICDQNQQLIQHCLKLTSPIIGNQVYIYPFHFVGIQKNGNIQITGTGINLPTPMRSDQSLSNGYIIIKQSFISTRIDISNRLIIAREQIKVHAGKYLCFKIQETHEVTTAGEFARYRVYNWYSPGLGLIKSEAYDKENRRISYQELYSVHPPHAVTTASQPPQNNS